MSTVSCPGLRGGVWCALCYSGARGRSFYKGHRGFRKSREGVSMGRYVNAKPAKAGPGQPVAVLADPAFERALPALWEYLTLRTYDDGSPRQAATLLVFVEDGTWKVCLSDREAQRSAWAAAETFQSALSALEASVASGAVQWRTARPQQGKGKR